MMLKNCKKISKVQQNDFSLILMYYLAMRYYQLKQIVTVLRLQQLKFNFAYLFQITAAPKQKQHAMKLTNFPPQFNEIAMRRFFSQFGKVQRIKIFKSLKTGNSQGQAYIQFQEDKITDIAANALNGYIMFGMILKAQTLDVDISVFDNIDNLIGKSKKQYIEKMNQPHTEEEFKAEMEKLQKILKEKQDKLDKLNINYKINTEIYQIE